MSNFGSKKNSDINTRQLKTMEKLDTKLNYELASKAPNEKTL
jgi:hypothetical protein